MRIVVIKLFYQLLRIAITLNVSKLSKTIESNNDREKRNKELNVVNRVSFTRGEMALPTEIANANLSQRPSGDIFEDDDQRSSNISFVLKQGSR